MNEEEQNQEQKKALLTLAIELGDKKKQLLNIYLDSKPEQLAYDFCLQNNLDFDSMQNLTEEIKNALSNYKNDPNQNLKNQISEEAEQTTSNKKNKKSNEYEIGQSENNVENHNKIEQENEEKLENENINENKQQHIENKENESGPKTEEVSEENHEQGENQVQFHEKELNSEEYDINQGHESVNEHQVEHGEHIEEKGIAKMNENEIKENVENNIDSKEENNVNNEKSDIKLNNENAKENENKEEKENKKDENENEEELAKEEAGDEMMDINENEEEEAIPSYLSPTICFQYKQRQIAQPKPKPEFSDFDTSYKKKDKTKEFVNELHEEVVTHLDINQNNQKYLPKDYYDNPEGKNFGERLYQKELKLKEEAMEKIKNKIVQENKSKEENLTFIPKINDYNIVVLQKRKANKQQYNDENRIIHYKDYLQSVQNKVKYKCLTENDENNTFIPKINKKSEKMTAGRSTKVPRYEQLYKTKLDMKKLEQKVYDEQNMFKPKINKNYKGGKSTKGENKSKNMADYASLTFEERQKKFREKIEEKRGKLIEQKNNNIDMKTGKKYFNPTINKNKKLDEERKNKPIFNELYSDSAKYKIKKEELEKKVLELEQFNTVFKASERSEEIYDKQKNIAFEKIFKRLDNDKDGQISKSNIDLYGISKRMLKILSSIMQELKDGATISSEEFVKKCEKIYVNLNYADKKELFIYSMGGAIKSVYETEPFRRKQISRKSKGKSLRSTVKTNNGNDEKYLKELKQSHVNYLKKK